MSLKAGTFQEMTVEREVSPYGYFLSDGSSEVLLHYSEIEGDIHVGQQLRVFLFFDTKDRIAATMKTPLISLGETALLEIAEIHPRLGCFLDMGLGRQLLLPFRQLPEEKMYRPKTGDKVFVTMVTDKQGRLMAKLAGEEELSKLVFHAPSLWKNRWIPAIVYKSLKIGTFVVCEGDRLGFGALGFIHESERVRPLRVGERLEVRVTYVREDGRVNCSMKQPKEINRDRDSEAIYQYLLSRPNGAMPYSDETPADIISQRFQISKGAFKRALGKLMKEGKVTQQGSWTYLKKDEE